MNIGDLFFITIDTTKSSVQLVTALTPAWLLKIFDISGKNFYILFVISFILIGFLFFIRQVLIDTQRMNIPLAAFLFFIVNSLICITVSYFSSFILMAGWDFFKVPPIDSLTLNLVILNLSVYLISSLATMLMIKSHKNDTIKSVRETLVVFVPSFIFFSILSIFSQLFVSIVDMMSFTLSILLVGFGLSNLFNKVRSEGFKYLWNTIKYFSSRYVTLQNEIRDTEDK